MTARTRPQPKFPARSRFRPPLPKRFYKAVMLSALIDGIAVQLDGRGDQNSQEAASSYCQRKRLAEAVAAEWSAQREVIDPATMPLTQDRQFGHRCGCGSDGGVAADIAAFAAWDLLCYRAEDACGARRATGGSVGPGGGMGRDARSVLAFDLAAGVMPIEQSGGRTCWACCECSKSADAFRLAALHVMTTLYGIGASGSGACRGAAQPSMRRGPPRTSTRIGRSNSGARTRRRPRGAVSGARNSMRRARC